MISNSVSKLRNTIESSPIMGNFFNQGVLRFRRFETERSFRYTMKGLNSHILNGIPGYGMPLQSLDVSCVLDVECNKRLFRIFDQSYPYTLRIKYYMPNGDYPFMFPNINIYSITRRYDDMEDALQEMKIIKTKKELLYNQYLKTQTEDKRF